MDAEEYIAQYGATLTESEQRYIRAFGAPQYHEGPSRNPSTPGLIMSGRTNRVAHDGGAASTTVEPPHET
jgi:hypothetical protein